MLGVIGLAAAVAAVVWSGIVRNPKLAATASHADSDSVEPPPSAQEAWRKARFHVHQRTPADLMSCVRYADEAIRIDPTYPSGHAVRSACHFVRATLGIAPTAEALTEAERSAKEALALDPSHGGANIAMGTVVARRDHDWSRAEHYLRTAAESNPGFDYARADYGLFLAWSRRHQEALAEAREGERLSPTVPILAQNVAQVLYLARRFDESLAQARHAVALDTTFFPSHERLSLAHAALGHHEAAVTAMEQAVRLAPGMPPLRGSLGYMYARAGRTAEARRVLQTLLDTSRTAYVPKSALAVVYLGLGDDDAALHWLERAYDERDAELVMLGASPLFDPLRGHRRFRELLRRLNF